MNRRLTGRVPGVNVDHVGGQEYPDRGFAAKLNRFVKWSLAALILEVRIYPLICEGN